MAFADTETQRTINKNDFKHVKDRSTPPTISVTGASISMTLLNMLGKPVYSVELWEIVRDFSEDGKPEEKELVSIPRGIFLIEENALRGIGQMFIDFIDKMRETEPDYMAELAKLADEIAARSDTKMKADAEVEAKRNPRKKKGSKS